MNESFKLLQIKYILYVSHCRANNFLIGINFHLILDCFLQSNARKFFLNTEHDFYCIHLTINFFVCHALKLFHIGILNRKH